MTAPSPVPASWPPARLHVVTGKGGVGKTTVAGALAIALAAGQRRTLLIEVEGRNGVAQLFEAPQPPYAERRIAIAPDGGEVFALAVDAEAALLEYLELFYNLRRAGRLLRRMGAIDFATTIAPGLRDVLLTGKVKEATTRVADGRRVYDAVVLDAPPTGRVARFLNVTADVAGLARVGPIKTQSDGVTAVLHSSQTAVHLVTTLEEMPVQETLDAVAQLDDAKLPVGAVVINMAEQPELSEADLALAERGRLDRPSLAAALTSAGLDGDALAGPLADEAAAQAARHRLEQGYRDQIAELGLPTYELPRQTAPMDLGGLYELAESLGEQGV